MQTTVGQTTLELCEGDIADQATDAVVTAAHWDLRGGQGTDGSIHFKAGPELLRLCKEIGGCPMGEAVITPGFRLKARFVIHAVGPTYELGDDLEQDLLKSAYTFSLKLAVENQLSSISFPSISTGAFGYPMREAAPIALDAIVSFLREQPHALKLVRLVLFPGEFPKAYSLHVEVLRELLAKSA
jgi:O-acetyl-ADP-ribose deacetylase (regulator of RNase III)